MWVLAAYFLIYSRADRHYSMRLYAILGTLIGIEI